MLSELRKELQKRPGRRHVVDLTRQEGPPESDPENEEVEARGRKRAHPESESEGASDLPLAQSEESEEEPEELMVGYEENSPGGSLQSLLPLLRQELSKIRIPASPIGPM